MRAGRCLIEFGGKPVDELRGDAPGPAAALHGPLQGTTAQSLLADRQIAGLGIGFDHGQIHVLIGAVNADPQAESVGKGDFFLNRLMRIDGVSGLVFRGVPGHQVPTVGCGVKNDILRPSHDTAIQDRFQGFVVRVLTFKGQIVAEDDAATFLAAQKRQESRQGGKIVTRDLDQNQRSRALSVDMRVRGFDEGGLAHAASAPQHDVVGRQAPGEVARVFKHEAGLTFDSAKQGEFDSGDLGHGTQGAGLSLPDEGIAAFECPGVGKRRGNALKRRGDAGEMFEQRRFQLKSPEILTRRVQKLWSAPVSGKFMPRQHSYHETESVTMNSGIVSFLPMIAVFIVFYFMLIRPQQTKQKELKAQLNSLRRGDRIQTAGGIIGTVQLAKEGTPEIDVEIAPGVKVQVVRSTISTILSSTTRPANDLPKGK